MAGSAGSIFVDLLLRDAKYTQGLNAARGFTRKWTDGANRDISSVRSSFSSVIGPIGGVSSAISGLAGVVAGAFSVTEIVRYSDEFKNLQGRLSLVTNSTQELVDTQNRLFDIAQETRSDLGATVTLYQRLTSAVKGLGISQEEVFLFTEQLNKQLITAGLSSNEAAAAIYQLTQAFNKGKLDGDEFRTILESAPPILEALERSLGKTRGEILQLSQDGKLAPQVLVDAVNEMADVTDARFSAFSQTVGQAFTELNNSFLQYIGTSPDVISATNGIVEVIEALSGLLDDARENNINLTTAIAGLISAYYELNLAIAKTRLNSAEFFSNPFNQDIIAKRKKEVDEYTNLLSGLADVTAEANGIVNNPNTGGGNNNSPQRSSCPSIDTKAAEQEQKRLESLYTKNRDLILDVDKATIDYIDTSRELYELQEKGIISYEQLNTALENLGEEYDKNSEKAEIWGIDLEQFGKKAAENIQDAFADFLFDPFQDGIDGMLLGFVDAVRKMIAEAQAAQLAKYLLGESAGGSGGGLFGDLLGGLFGAGGVGSSTANPNIPGTSYMFAEGGYLPPGQWGIAGENEAEYIYGGRTGKTVVPPGKANMGGAGNTYNIDARGADQGAVTRLEKALLTLAGPGQIEARVANAQARGRL